VTPDKPPTEYSYEQARRAALANWLQHPDPHSWGEERKLGDTPKPPAETCLCTLFCRSCESGNPVSGGVWRDIGVLGTALVRLNWETLLGTAALAAILLLVSREFWRPGLWGQSGTLA
jgi:hypothetical protein